mgnify:CR=1 FL=1
MIAITLFSLKENAIKEKYKKWTLDSVRPRMILLDSVKGFIDYSVVGLLNHSGTEYDFIEIIEITNQKEFEHDNAQGLGLEIAAEWNDWVDDYSIIFCEHIK